MTPRVTIIICTRNRAENLRETIAAVARCEVPADLRGELLIVDNGSTDSTPSVANEITFAHLPVRYIREARAGKGYAYNAGIAAARGDILLFTDDDVRPPLDWIEGMCRPIADGRADAVAGGVIFPAHYEKTLSRAPYREHRGWFASTESIDPDHPLWMVGANMALGRQVLAGGAGGTFDVNLGPGALGFGDETLLSFQLVDRGFRLVAALDVAVEHHFDLARLNREGMLEIARRMGRSAAYVDWHWHHKDYPLGLLAGFNMRVGLWARRLAHPRQWLGAKDPAEWELSRVRAIAFRQQYIIERRKPRRYERAAQLAIEPTHA